MQENAGGRAKHGRVYSGAEWYRRRGREVPESALYATPATVIDEEPSAPMYAGHGPFDDLLGLA